MEWLTWLERMPSVLNTSELKAARRSVFDYYHNTGRLNYLPGVAEYWMATVEERSHP